VTAEPFSAGCLAGVPDKVAVIERRDGSIELSNAALRAVLTRDGQLQSLTHVASGRETLETPGNRILLLDDRPLEYEAWDIDPFALETARDAAGAHTCAIVSREPLRCEVRFERTLGRYSTMSQTVRLDAGSTHLVFDTSIDWKDRRTLVKAMFPLALRARTATYETMFGAAERPTHANTDGDLAKYEVPGQRWADLSEPDFGLSLLSDTRHGYSCFGSELALSLIRGPLSPDRAADIGLHRFRYALYPHAGDWRAANTVREAACFARPMLWSKGTPVAILARPLVKTSAKNVVIDTIKSAEDGQGWIVRLYECTGARAVAQLHFGVPLREAWLSNTLEDQVSRIAVGSDGLTLEMSPFQICTLRLV
jgi:alpha-mannosidase